MSQRNPIDLKRKSFSRFEDAVEMRDLLTHETGETYLVIEDQLSGFTVTRAYQKSNDKNDYGLIGREIRQAWRGFVTNFVQIVVATMMFAKPYLIIGWVFDLVNIKEMPDWLNLKVAGDFVGLLGLLAMLHGMRFIYSYFSEKLIFDRGGVVHRKGIIAQKQVQIRYGDIKTIGVTQSVLDRMLGIGAVHLDSAGTNGDVDIEFKNIIDPISMRRQIQKLIDHHTNLRG